MRIIKQGRIAEQIFQLTCYHCTAVLEYERKDIYSSLQNELYIECPCCKFYNEHLTTNKIMEK